MAGGHTNILLATFDSPSVSPYRVNSGYRRPVGYANTTESDLGYSTMTPHEDSEIASSCVEPLIIGRDRYRPKQTSPKPSADVPTIPPPPPSAKQRTDSVSSNEISCISHVGPQTVLSPTSGSRRLPVTHEETVVAGQTVLSPHQMLAPVEVHMVDSQS